MFKKTQDVFCCVHTYWWLTAWSLLGEGEKGEQGPFQYCCLSRYQINCCHVSVLESIEKTQCFMATFSFYD